MMKPAVAAEWTKFWSVRATRWCLAGGTLLMAFYAVVSGLSQRFGGDQPQAAHGIAATGAVYLVEFCVLAVATLFVTSEYTSGAIRTTLQWVPVRPRLTTAKAAVVLPVLFVFGVLVAAFGMGVAKLAMLGNGLPTTFGDAAVTALGMGAYFAFLGVLSTGIAFILRSAAGTLVVLIVLLLPLPLLVSSYVASGALDYFPLFAGSNAMVPPGSADLVLGGTPPYGPWIGALICLLWAGAGLLGGTALLNRRDA
ncbi:ABC transporter permease [Amycolatopsis jiangsuensis]|uniref:ABC-2 type transport system permease protein n=1 Tax=Amycolatopsis jiangsuensis TaxID=1181879 RepID=A0A840IWS5_9PSEU|nr:ABC transporter permease [Amycolatopsis jiangsuensis]MBB4685885.1 ABC-2 type transport system permease protein [Amycolatopsis jiangsuensis]